MAKVNIAQSAKDCTYVLKFSFEQQLDFNKLLATASDITASFGLDSECDSRYRNKTAGTFFALEKKLRTLVFAKAQRLSGNLDHLLYFTNDDWQTVNRFLRLCCITADLLNPAATPRRETVDNHLQLYFAEDNGMWIILLTAGDKSSQEKDIKQAQQYWQDYLKRKNDVNY